MKRELTDHEKRCVNAILSHVTEYFDLRFTMSVEVSPRLKTIWPNLQWLLLAQLRNTITNDKAWGAHRHVIGDLLCSPDTQKIFDIFNPSNQVSILGEIVEKRADSGHKTADVLEIHDFRTLYGAIEPSASELAAVMQIYTWWDLKDAAELAKFKIKLRRIKELETNWSDQWGTYYRQYVKKKAEEGPLAQQDVLELEYTDLKQTVEAFLGRRENEPGYKIIIDRKPQETADDPADKLIQAVAREQVLMADLVAGKPLDPATRDQFARALHITPENVTAEKELEYLRNVIAEQKSKLKRALQEGGAGEAYNFKEAQAIAVGGGNTFHLLSHIYSNALLDVISERVNEGLPYMGWSAGSNLACPTIKTTNDMPIVQPPSFEAVGAVPFQINPHYLDAHPAGHGGETREDRIREFIEVNRDMYVAGLREGSTLRVEGNDMELLGDKPLRVFRFGHDPAEIEPVDDVNFLLQ